MLIMPTDSTPGSRCNSFYQLLVIKLPPSAIPYSCLCPDFLNIFALCLREIHGHRQHICRVEARRWQQHAKHAVDHQTGAHQKHHRQSYLPKSPTDNARAPRFRGRSPALSFRAEHHSESARASLMLGPVRTATPSRPRAQRQKAAHVRRCECSPHLEHLVSSSRIRRFPRTKAVCRTSPRLNVSNPHLGKQLLHEPPPARTKRRAHGVFPSPALRPRSIRFATFTQPISSTNPTAPRRG